MVLCILYAQQTRCTLTHAQLMAVGICNINVMRLMIQRMLCLSCNILAKTHVQLVYYSVMHSMHTSYICYLCRICLACKPYATCNTNTAFLTRFHAAASIGFTRRVGNTRLVHASLTQLLQAFPNTLPDPASTARDSSWASERRVALVFGREESGLTANELSLCTHSCSIPTGPVQPSLNLSHAACVVLAQLFEQRTSNHDAGVRSFPFTEVACLCSCIAAQTPIACMGACHYQPVPVSKLTFTGLCERNTIAANRMRCFDTDRSHKLPDAMQPLQHAIVAPMLITMKSITCLSRSHQRRAAISTLQVAV